jgi:SPP1 gp7 family putative phage head morphogenesis protein
MFSQVVRNGLLTGESSQSIARRLVGRLQLGERGSVRQMAEKGGELTTASNRQVMTLVRTSVNQVANAASQQVYEANQDITERYQYVATLDARTSSICAALDGRIFEYGKGPTPPQHFNCRSTTVPVIDYERLGFDPPPEGTRASMDGRVPADMSYGQWLQKQSQQTKRDVLGKEKVGYFELLAEKYGPRDAMAKLVRDDGSELTLEQLRRRYGAIKEG